VEPAHPRRRHRPCSRDIVAPKGGNGSARVRIVRMKWSCRRRVRVDAEDICGDFLKSAIWCRSRC
jgi:hypothetical protein